MDVFKIGMHLTLTNGVSSVLAAITSQMLGMHGHIGKIEKGFANWNKALIGGAALGAAGGIIFTLKKITDHAKELSHELASLQAMNLSGGQIGAIQSEAQRLSTGGVLGTTQAGNIRLAGRAYSLVGADEATKMMEPLAKFGRVFGANIGNMAKGDDQLDLILRSGELMGKLTDPNTGHVDTQRLLKYLDVAAKVSAATHGRVGPADAFRLAQQGGPALAGMSDEGLLSMFMATQDMGGMRAGTALTALYQQMVGGKMTKSVAERLQGLGLVGGFTTGQGGHVTFNQGALDNDFTRAIKTDPLAAAEILKTSLEKHGIFGQNAQTQELFSILGRQTTQRLVSDLLRNEEQKSGERLRISGSQGLLGQYDTRMGKDYLAVEDSMKKAWENLLQSIAGPNAENAIVIMKKITETLNSFADTINKTDPEVIRRIFYGIAAFGGLMAIGGMVAFMTMIGTTGWFVLGITAVSAAIIKWGPAIRDMIVDWMSAGIEKLGNVVAKVGGGIKSFFEWISDWLGRVWDKIGPSKGTGPTAPPGGGSYDAMGNYTPSAYHPGGGLNDNYKGGDGSLYDAIIKAEGTGAHGNPYDTSLGYLTPPKPLSQMTLSESLAWGEHIRRQTAIGRRTNSSAKGAFQIVNSTQRAAMRALGYSGNELFDKAHQQAMADWIHQHQGLGAWEGFKTGHGRRALHDYTSRSKKAIEEGVTPPPRRSNDIHVHNTTSLDGEVVARNTTRKQAHYAYFPTSSGDIDPHGRYYDSGTRFSDVG
jgi:hypothetical protein